MRVWKNGEPGIGWWIATIAPPSRDLQLLIAANRAAAYGATARWVVHDLRNPAQSLTLLADLLADPDTEVEDILRQSCRHLGRSLDLLTQILHPSPAAKLGPISVGGPLHLIRDLHHASRARARLEVSLDSSVHAAAGIEPHLEHALLNLLLNAHAALQLRADGSIRIGAHNDGDRVAIVVADNGPGLAPDLAGGLFERPLTAKPGTQMPGVGLLVAGELLRISGGTLTYAPGPDPGARFVISLPRWRRAAARRER